jgi:hypothetical protein
MDKRKKIKGQTMIYNQKDKQYNGQKKKDQGTNNDLQSKGQTIQWTKEKKPRDKQVFFLLSIVLFVLLFVDHCLSLGLFSFVHCIVCPSDCRSLFVPWSFFLCPYNTMDKRKKTKGQTMIYKQEDKQYNGQKKKDQGTNNDLQSEGQTIQWTKEKRPCRSLFVPWSFFFCPLYCLSFCL